MTHHRYSSGHSRRDSRRKASRRAANREWVRCLKVVSYWMRTGYFVAPEALQWHHLSRRRKEGEAVAKLYTRTRKRIWLELQRCIAVTQEEHDLITHGGAEPSFLAFVPPADFLLLMERSLPTELHHDTDHLRN